MSGAFGKVPHLQKVIQSAHGYVHLRGGGADKLTSVVIPSLFGIGAAGCLVTGLFGMYTGTGKME